QLVAQFVDAGDDFHVTLSSANYFRGSGHRSQAGV
ncbi:MAG: hypothetical protein ACI83P_001328, partial [Janthinobacterium sp.]